MLEYEMFQAREAEMHRTAAHERKVRTALRNRREARRLARAAEESSRASAGGIAGSVRPAV
ncbi:hypothetical protein [Streptodolium elevatio]|uniref:Uncharacterized protein n=1 Tax=Streptodolium elevatio TaxID=3157996 RepID=A0ABV3DB93_9ACTN